MPLSDKRQAFVNEYEINGHNATQAYKTAYPGCKSGQDRAGHRLLSFVEVKQAIGKARAKLMAKHVADKAERQEFWTDTMKTAPNMCDKLRASELLGKSECDFIDLGLTAAIDVPAPVSAEQVEEFRAMARAATKLRLSS